MSKKIYKNVKAKQVDDSSSEGLTPENQKWLNEHPTRMEVASYVNALWERHYLPTITNYIQMSSMVLQAILIEKGVCTGDEIKSITEKFVSEQQRRMAIDTLEDGLVSVLNKTVANIKDGTEVVSTEDEKAAICSALEAASKTLININLHPPVSNDDIITCAGNLESIKSAISDGSIKSDDEKFMAKLTRVLNETIHRLNQRLQTNEAKGDEKS